MFFSTQLSLKAKLIILAVIPLCCAVGFGWFLTHQRINELDQFVSFREAMNLANTLANVNEANNAELGNSWCWSPTAIKENGAEVVQKVRATWEDNARELDKSYAELVALREKLDFSKYDPQLKVILGQVETAMTRLTELAARLLETMEYTKIIDPYNDLKTRIQALYPALLKETSDKDLSQRLNAYNLYLDYHSACVQYIGVMIWGHQIDKMPPGGYARYESYYRESETLLKHFRNLAPAPIVAKVDALLTDDRGRWVDERVKNILTSNESFHDFGPHRSQEAEFKAKGEGRNADLGKVMALLRQDIMDYTSARIAELEFKRNLAIGIILVAIALSVGFTIWLSATLSRSVKAVAEGLAGGADQVYAAAKQISEASEDLAKSASEQSASVQQTMTMIEQIQTRAMATTANADKATGTIERTSKIASESSTKMADMNKSIQQIAQNSAETRKILHAINDIAFQTNILALNAAVEAARAGEQGAGFAVVAEEVRNLAQRSASASNDTNNLIDNSTRCVEQGATAAKQADGALGKLLQSTDEVSKCVADIARDAQQQTAAISEINQSAAQVGDITNKNAASAEECAASALTLREQAQSLETYVGQLKAFIQGS